MRLGHCQGDCDMFRFVGLCASIVCVVCAAATVAAQERGGLPPNSAFVVDPNGTSVQLPTFNFFTISTTVLVPDRGSMVIGGVNSGSSASGQSGGPLFSQRAGGSAFGGGNVSIGVQIHDLKEMDRQMLAGAAGAKSGEAVNHWAVRVEEARKSSAGRPTMSVAEARRLRASGSVR